jgi:hypothetical protein
MVHLSHAGLGAPAICDGLHGGPARLRIDGANGGFASGPDFVTILPFFPLRSVS